MVPWPSRAFTVTFAIGAAAWAWDGDAASGGATAAASVANPKARRRNLSSRDMGAWSGRARKRVKVLRADRVPRHCRIRRTWLVDKAVAGAGPDVTFAGPDP